MYEVDKNEQVRRSWQLFVSGRNGSVLLRPSILQSWQRCRQNKVAPVGDTSLHRVPQPELDQRLARNAALISTAAPLLRIFSADFPEHVAHVLYLTDRDGIVLFSVGDEQIKDAFGLHPGFDWSECRMGTNGAGTAIASSQPIAIVGPEHYQQRFHEATCLAAPIIVDGRLVGAIDLSTSVSDSEGEHLRYIEGLAQLITMRLQQHSGAAPVIPQ